MKMEEAVRGFLSHLRMEGRKDTYTPSVKIQKSKVKSEGGSEGEGERQKEAPWMTIRF